MPGLPDALELAQRMTGVPSLGSGYHDEGDGMCAMEAASYIAGEAFSDHPGCVAIPLGAFLRTWNDTLPEGERNSLLRPLIPRVVGTRQPDAAGLEEEAKSAELRMSFLALDWLTREQAPAWLDLAGLGEAAGALRSLPPITALSDVAAVVAAIDAAEQAASATWYRVRDAQNSTAYNKARDAAEGAFREADKASGADAARSASTQIPLPSALTDAAYGALRNAVYDAAASVAWLAAARMGTGDVAATAALQRMRGDLQRSAIRLVERMIAIAPRREVTP